MNNGSSDADLDSVQAAQDQQYDFPYHYIPVRFGRKASTCMRFTWGFEYLAGLDMVLHQLAAIKLSSLLDVGCGDGRFLREVRARMPGVELQGVDYSRRAIDLARAMNPSIPFECMNIASVPLPQRYDVATLIEVIEHIPPSLMDSFVHGVRRSVREGGRLIVTVPHANYPLVDKHYQHFTSSSLRQALEPHFKVERIVPFGRMSLLARAVSVAVGMSGGRVVIDSPRIGGLLYRRYLEQCIAGQSEQTCVRLLAVACA